MYNPALTEHMRYEREERHARVNEMRERDNATVYAIIDCGNYGTSGRYECHVVYTNATVDIYNKRGALITQKILTDKQLYWNYPVHFSYDYTPDSNGKALYDYALVHRLNHEDY